MTKAEIEFELAQCEKELEYQVGHTRIAYLQERIAELETELKHLEADKELS